VRTWLLGDFRLSVGSTRSIGGGEWHLRKAGNLIRLLDLAPGHRLHREQARDLLGQISGAAESTEKKPAFAV